MNTSLREVVCAYANQFPQVVALIINTVACTSLTCMYGFCLEHQNQRGGKVKLQSIVMPVMEFEHSEKGDALYGKQTFGKEHELFMDSTVVFQSTTVTSIC